MVIRKEEIASFLYHHGFDAAAPAVGAAQSTEVNAFKLNFLEAKHYKYLLHALACVSAPVRATRVNPW